MTRAVAFKQADVKRAVKGAIAAGLSVAAVKIGHDGEIVIEFGTPRASDPYEDWKREKAGGRGET